MAGPASGASGMAPVPAHVPANLVYDFDLYNAAGLDEDFHLAINKLHEPQRARDLLDATQRWSLGAHTG